LPRSREEANALRPFAVAFAARTGRIDTQQPPTEKMMHNPIAETTDRLQGSVDRMAQSAHRAVDRVADRAVPAIDHVRNTAERTTDLIGAGVDELVRRQDMLRSTVSDQVRAHPLAVVGTALLLGLLLGRLSR